MSSQSKNFRVGEKVLFPQLKFQGDGKLALIKVYWQIETIFPVSKLVIINNNKETKTEKLQMQISLKQLQAYN